MSIRVCCDFGDMQLPAQRDKNMASGPATGGLLCVFSVIAEELSRVKTLIEDELSDCGNEVRGLASHISFGRGKMVRPGLLLLSGLVCGSITDEHIRAAAIVELIHNATLLHDDVVDEGTSRRGLPTLNRLRGNESAVLLGDFLLSRVFKTWVELDRRAARIIASAAVRTCEGEIRQTAQRGNWQLGETEYIDIIAVKSAALFSGACAVGAMLAGADESKVNKLAEYGQNTGIAFQITDDLLDLTGDEAKTGKAGGNDLDRNKLTLPVIHLLKRAGAADKKAIKKALARKFPDGVNDGLLEKLHSCGSIEYARKLAAKFTEGAIAALAGLDESKYRKALVEAARFIVGRTA
jgi:octaprenyl-diphosphate synthase